MAYLYSEVDEKLDYDESERLYKAAIEKGHVGALNNLLSFYLSRSKKNALISILNVASELLEYINVELTCIAYLYTGQMTQYESLLKVLLKNENVSTEFLTWMIRLKQHKTVMELFDFKSNLKEQNLLLYYAFNIIYSSDDQFKLVIPPELLDTVNLIVTDIKEYHENNF